MTDPYERSCEILNMAEQTQRTYRDVELIREALTALQGVETTGINEYEYRGVPKQIVLAVRPAIAKLEERLLRE